MNVAKKIFIGSIILLLLTPVLIAAGVNDSTPTTTTDTNGNNSLGTVTVLSYPWHFSPLSRGAQMFWTPATVNNNIYFFKEINGTVRMNFTLTIKHRLNAGPIPFIILPRYTVVEYLWISDPGPGGSDYFKVFNETICATDSFVTYTINITEDMQKIDLQTNGQNKTLIFLLGMGVDAGKLKKVMTDGSIWRLGRFYSYRQVIQTDITIVPTQDP
jgi:hypothetical protein